MLANFLNKSKPINFIGLLIFFFISYVSAIGFAVFSNGFSIDKLFKTILLLLLFLGVFFFYNFIISKNRLTFDNSYAYFIFTLLIISVLTELTEYKGLILAIIYLLFLRKIYSLRSSKKVIQKLFDSGFWVGILFILEPLSVLFLIVIFIGVYLHQKITIHTLFTPIIGFFTPVFIYFAYFFWIDKTEEFTKLFNLNINFDIQFYSQPKYIWFITCVFTVSLLAIIFKSIETITVSNTFRRSWVLLITNFIVATFLIFALPVKNGSEFIFILFPVSVIITNGIQLIEKKTLKNLILYAFLIGSIFVQFFL
jgi:hypothetical protein